MNQEIPQPDQQQSKLASVDVGGIIGPLKNYNDQFSLGHTAARIFMAATGDLPESEAGVANEQKVDEFMTLDQMKADTEPLLNATGLEYQPVQANWFVAGSGDDHIGSEMRLNLKDGQQFVKYLKALDPKHITENQRVGLREVIVVLGKQFTSYDLTDHNDERLMEFMGNLAFIISEYKRLLMDDDSESQKEITKLETYLTYARKGCLREYREAEELHLLTPPTGKGFILRWHIDASPDLLKKKWDSVIDTLQMISQNNKATELYNTVRINAGLAIEAAITEVAAWPDTRKQKTEFLSILNTTKARMSEF